jgi:hypothetical protein
MVIETLNQNTGIAQDAVIELVKNLPENRDCECDQNLKDAIMTQRDKIDPEVKKKLASIIKKYI